MRFTRVLLAALLAAVWACTLAPLASASLPGTGACIGCTVVVGMAQQMALIHKKTATVALKDWCNDLTQNNAVEICNTLGSVLGPLLDLDLALGKSPTHTCVKTVKMCKDETAKCDLFPTWPPKRISTCAFEKATSAESLAALDSQRSDLGFAQALLATDNTLTDFLGYFAARFAELLRYAPKDTTETRTPAEMISALADYAALSSAPAALQAEAAALALVASALSAKNKSFGDANGGTHFALVDKDGDRKSTFAQLRGFDWAGRDCNDWDKDIYPGRKARDSTKPSSVDHNCNGIQGANPATKRSYEEELCAGTQQFGLISVGDSATAHFAAPPAWLDPSKPTGTAYGNIIKVISNEADWPQCSSTTGWESPAGCPEIHGGVNQTSFYQKLRQANRCSHRDYHNVGVNGGSSRNMGPNGGIIDSLVRDQANDHPVILNYALIGNDVCGSNPSRMTSVEDFEKNTIEVLDYMDTKLPAGSQVLLGGLVDGRVLYDTMAELMHPAGMKYKEFYSFLNCLETSPCAGWMNTDKAIRDATTTRARELSNVYSTIIAKKSYRNFNMTYIPTMELFQEVVDAWTAQGRPAQQLIEGLDGFHPSTTSQSLLADKVWNYALSRGLSVPVNPNNAKIEALFGNQGGYTSDVADFDASLFGL